MARKRRHKKHHTSAKSFHREDPQESREARQEARLRTPGRTVAARRKKRKPKKPLKKERWRPRFVFNKEWKALVKKAKHVDDRIMHGK